MRRIVRSIVPSRLRRAWRAARYRRLLSRLAGPKLLQAFGAAYPSAVFIEIGSNAGDHHDHLRPLILSRQWRGLMVEPVPYVFDRLQSNYGDLDRVTLVNVAIADRDGRLPFYHLREAGDSDRDGCPSGTTGSVPSPARPCSVTGAGSRTSSGCSSRSRSRASPSRPSARRTASTRSTCSCSTRRAMTGSCCRRSISMRCGRG